MKIAFVHYHLKQGGVTTVLKQQVEALRDNCEILVLTGEPPVNCFPADTVHVPGLGYYNGVGSRKMYDPEKVAGAVQKAILKKFKGECDILHVHNPTLAKNRNFLKILCFLQKSGIRLFLQIHDFAEDGRPLSFFAESEYPPDSHYGVINSRDYEILLKSGLTEKGLHYLPNAVIMLNCTWENTDSEKNILYPVRGIRRKNIGEAILLSLFFKNNETLSITLPPNSQPDIDSFIGWKKFISSNRLKVNFNAGLKNDFEKLVSASKFLITTSITEGFGFTFLEPWTANKFLWGRRLDGICDGFEKNGVNLDHLYSNILVPLKWIERDIFYKRWKGCWMKNCTAFKFDEGKKNTERFFNKIIIDDHIDFGLLDEQFQKKVILKVISEKKSADELTAKNPHILPPADLSDKTELIKNNMEAVKKKYNQTIYKKRLLEIYLKVVKTPVIQSIDKNILASCFLNPKQFSLLKWCDYVE